MRDYVATFRREIEKVDEQMAQLTKQRRALVRACALLTGELETEGQQVVSDRLAGNPLDPMHLRGSGEPDWS